MSTQAIDSTMKVGDTVKLKADVASIYGDMRKWTMTITRIVGDDAWCGVPEKSGTYCLPLKYLMRAAGPAHAPAQNDKAVSNAERLEEIL